MKEGQNPFSGSSPYLQGKYEEGKKSSESLNFVNSTFLTTTNEKEEDDLPPLAIKKETHFLPQDVLEHFIHDVESKGDTPEGAEINEGYDPDANTEPEHREDGTYNLEALEQTDEKKATRERELYIAMIEERRKNMPQRELKQETDVPTVATKSDVQVVPAELEAFSHETETKTETPEGAELNPDYDPNAKVEPEHRKDGSLNLEALEQTDEKKAAIEKKLYVAKVLEDKEKKMSNEQLYKELEALKKQIVSEKKSEVPAQQIQKLGSDFDTKLNEVVQNYESLKKSVAELAQQLKGNSSNNERIDYSTKLAAIDAEVIIFSMLKKLIPQIAKEIVAKQ